jgi:outer membrane protein TolC
VIQNYYGIIASQRKLANARVAVQEAQRFYDITEAQEKGGEAAHLDVIKAEIDLRQRERDVAESEVAVQKAAIALGVGTL